jgi:hypothetical protein
MCRAPAHRLGPWPGTASRSSPSTYHRIQAPYLRQRTPIRSPSRRAAGESRTKSDAAIPCSRWARAAANSPPKNKISRSPACALARDMASCAYWVDAKGPLEALAM